MSHIKHNKLRKCFRPDDWMTTGQVALLCKVAPRTVQKWCDCNLLPYIRLPTSNDRRFLTKDIMKFVQELGYPTPPELGGYYTFHVMIASQNRELAKHLHSLPNNGERVGYRVLTAESGWAAANLCLCGNVDLIIVDWTDAELAKQIMENIQHEIRPWIVELLPEDNCNQAKSARAVLSMKQPIDPKLVLQGIRNTCEGVNK